MKYVIKLIIHCYSFVNGTAVSQDLDYRYDSIEDAKKDAQTILKHHVEKSSGI